MTKVRAKFSYLLLLLSLLDRSKGTAALGGTEKSWTYTLLESNFESTDKNKFNMALRVERMGRGEFGLTGDVTMDSEVPEDSMIEVKVYRSTDGTAEYKLQPMAVEKQTIYEAMNNFYKKMIMSTVAECSNLPQFEDTCPKLGPDNFTMNKCQISNDAFPAYVPEGYYKIHFLGTGTFEFKWELQLIIERKGV